MSEQKPMQIPPHYRVSQPRKCLNCTHYMGAFHGYLGLDECAVYHVLVGANAICDEYVEHVRPTLPIEIKEFMKAEGDKE